LGVLQGPDHAQGTQVSDGDRVIGTHNLDSRTLSYDGEYRGWGADVDHAPYTGDIDLDAVSTREELAVLLRTVHIRADKPSLRTLEAKTRHSATPLSKSVVAEMLKGVRFPRKGVMAAFLQACGVPDESVESWLRAWDRVAAEGGLPRPEAARPARDPQAQAAVAVHHTSQVTGDAQPVLLVAGTQPDRPPYKGLRAFETVDRDLFFGRARVVRELVGAVAAHSLVPVVGASGVGKSSVVNAGLLPRLNEEAGWGFVTVRPRPTLELALAAGLARLSSPAVSVQADDLEAWQERLSRLGLFRAAELACTASGLERVLVTVDQFEEVLTQDCEELLHQLAELPHEGALTVVLTLREDSFGELFVRHASFGERLRRSAVAVRGMDLAELKEIVRCPAELRGVRIAPSLVEELAEAVLDRPGALPLLEFSLDQMWRTLRCGQDVLSSSAYEEIGGLNGALAAHADKVLAGMNEMERAAVRNLFVNHLTSPEQPDVRRVLRRPECTATDWRVISRLANERLLTIGRDDDGNQTAEVVHEALLGAWGQLRGWLDAERPFRRWQQRLRDAMAAWAETGDDRTLLTGALLADSQRWLDERDADLSPGERGFIEKSRKRREDEEHRYQVLYERSLARTLSHAAEATQDPVLALLLAVEVAERSPDPQAERLIRACLSRLGAAETGTIPAQAGAAAHNRFLQRMTLADWCRGPDASGRWVLGSSADGLVINHHGQARHGTGGVIPMPGPVVVAACTQAGLAFLGTERGELAIWQLSDTAEKVSSRDLGVPISCLAISETTQTFAAACDDGLIRVLHGEKLSDIACLRFSGFARDIDLNADRKVAALGYDRRIRVWDLVSQALVCESVAGTDASRLSIDPGEDYILVGHAAAGGTVSRFPLSAEALRTWALQAAGRELTPAERRRYIDDPSVR
jgi:hypothetical protein